MSRRKLGHMFCLKVTRLNEVPRSVTQRYLYNNHWPPSLPTRHGRVVTVMEPLGQSWPMAICCWRRVVIGRSENLSNCRCYCYVDWPKWRWLRLLSGQWVAKCKWTVKPAAWMQGRGCTGCKDCARFGAHSLPGMMSVIYYAWVYTDTFTRTLVGFLFFYK